MTLTEFNKTIKNDIILVMFTADWCNSCIQMKQNIIPQLEADGYTVIKVNVDDSPEISAEYGVRSIPTFQVFKDGVPTNSFIGSTTKEALLKML